MPTQQYRNAQGERLPGVTWVLGQNLGWNKDPLMKWANREGLAGRDIRGDRSTAQQAADIGSVVHTMIEALVMGWDEVAAAGSTLTCLPDADQAKVHRGVDGYRRWARNNKIKLIATEIYGVDAEYQTGYCLDALGLDEEGLSLIDWKTSKGTYADHVIQVAAYTEFIERRLTTWFMSPVRLSGAHVLRTSKDSGTFKHVFWPREDLEKPWQCFTWLRALHQAKPTIEAMAR